MLLGAGWILAGCSTLSSMNPVNWWHREEGGKIAEQRPAPPGADQPYPNIATVPARPEPPDAEALKNLTASLVADRTNAQHAAQSAPLADPSSPTASPGLFGIGSTPPPPPRSATPPAPAASAAPSGPLTASASMPAVDAPAAPPAPAPRKAVQSAPLAAPPQPAEPVSAPQPDLPAAPPARPGIAGAAPAAVVVPAPMPAPAGGTSADIVFVAGASSLSAAATDEVKAFAARRGNGTIVVTGYGDAVSADPDAQSAAVNLGLSRAQSVLDVLKAAGVPGNAIRVSAEASGRGASLHLLQ